MATAPDANADEIRRLNRESDRLEAEARKLLAEASVLNAERFKRDSARPVWVWFAQGLAAAIVIMGIGGAFAVLVFP